MQSDRQGQNRPARDCREQTADRSALDRELAGMSEKCIECKLCARGCLFLQKYGKPKQIADNYTLAPDHRLPFECSLCRLCAAVCPVGLDPGAMFLEMRRAAVAGGQADLRPHGGLLAYERRGTSRAYAYYGLPAGCDTVFFPGCALAGTRPGRVLQVYEKLRCRQPALGIVLDCCTKPSHDLGRLDFFQAMFGRLVASLVSSGVKQVLVACPSCYAVFKKYGRSLTVRTVYQELLDHGQTVPGPAGPAVGPAPVTVQDSCTARDEEDLHRTVRELIRQQGASVEEMRHHGSKTLCCGEGAGVGFIAPVFSRAWGRKRQEEAQGRRMITYCAGCANFLGRVGPVAHILDLVFEPAKTLAGRVKGARPPFTYLNRLILKWRLRRRIKRSGD